MWKRKGFRTRSESDEMSVKIHTKCSAELIDSMGDDLRIANAARVSFAKWRDEFKDDDARLIKYLARHDHWTPFSQVVATIRIDAPIFVARQWFKGTVGVTRNETSRRYVDTPPEFYIPEQFHKRPAGGIKQGSGDELSPTVNIAMQQIARHNADKASLLYSGLLRDGLAPEEARMFLPQNMMTQWVETGSLAYFARTCALRLDSHAQLAIQQLAQEVSGIVETIAPIAWSALMEKSHD